MPLPREHLLDELATAYVQAVAAIAGATIAVSRLDYGVDGTLNQIVRARGSRLTGERFVPEGLPVEFQLKGTTIATVREDHLLYDLNVRNYDLIVGRSPVATPLYLFLVCFRHYQKDWVAIGSERLILRASAYYWAQTESPTGNVSTVRIRIPIANRLTARAIGQMFKASRDRFGTG